LGASRADLADEVLRHLRRDSADLDGAEAGRSAVVELVGLADQPPVQDRFKQ